MATVQKTLGIVKPNVFREGHVEEVLERIGKAGLVVADTRTVQLDDATARRFYAEHTGKTFFERLVKYMTSGPVRVMVLAGTDAIHRWRDLIGPTEHAREKAPDSLRGLFGTDLENGFHGSDCPASARREILFFFKNQRVESGMTPESANEYLAGAVNPLLVKGLTVLCKEKPEDPVLFLANWLLDNNPNKPKVVAPPQQSRQAGQQPLQKYRTKKDIVFVLGGPGCGKGTQCARLADEFKLAHLSAGDLLRAEVAKGTPEGQAIEKTIKEGKLVPQEVIIKLLAEAIVATDRKGVLVDGFPRSADQLAKFEEVVKPCKVAILFDCSEEVMLKRIMKRAEATPAEQRRSDDNVDTAKKRFRTFQEETQPALARLRDAGKLIVIDASGDIETVHLQARQVFV